MLGFRNSDRGYIRRALRGDRAAYGTLIERHLRAVYAVAYAHTGNHADAEDVSQDTFLKAYTSLNGLRDTARFEGWLTTIARNAARSLTKREARPEIDSSLSAGNATARPDPASDELRAMLRESIEELDAGSKEVLLLHYFAGRSTKEIARSLELSQAAVLKRLQRARERLGTRLLKDFGDAFAPRKTLDAQAKVITKSVAAIGAAGAASDGTGGIAASAVAQVSIGKSVVLAASALALSAAAIAGWNVVRDGRAGPDLTWEADGPSVLSASANVSGTALRAPSSIASRVLADEDIAAVQLNAKATEPETLADIGTLAAADEQAADAQDVLDRFLSGTFSITFEDIHISELMVPIVEQYGVEILIDDRAVGVPAIWKNPNARVSPDKSGWTSPTPYVTDGVLDFINLRGMSLVTMLKAVCRPLLLDYVSEPGFVWISTPELLDVETYLEPESRYDEYDTEVNLTQEVSVTFEDTHIRDILDFISETYSVTTAWDYGVIQPPPGVREHRPSAYPPGVVTDGMIVHTSLKKIRLKDVFKVLLRPLGLTYVLEEDLMWISSPERIGEDFSRQRSQAEASEIHSILDEWVGIVFEFISLQDVLDFITSTYELNMVLDQRVVLPPMYKDEDVNRFYARPAPLRGSFPVATDGIVRNINLQDVQVSRALENVLRLIDLAYEVVDGRLLISKPGMLQDEDIPIDRFMTATEMSGLVREIRTEYEAREEASGSPVSDEVVLPIGAPTLLSFHNGSKDASSPVPRVRLDFGDQKIWLKEGDQRGDYEVLKIHVDIRCVTMLFHPMQQRYPLCLEPAQ